MTGPKSYASKRQVDEATAAKIVALWRDHEVPVVALAQRFKVSKTYVRKIIQDADEREPKP